MKEKKIQEALAHSQHAVRVLSQLAQGSQELREAYGHLKMAVQKMEHQAHKAAKRQEANQTAAQQWWGTVQSGATSMAATANQPSSKMAEQAAMRTLKELDRMLSVEQKKLNELENKVKPQPKPDQQPADDGPSDPQSGQVFFG
jgi:aldehyde:ferredoxin oxidoreductase